MPRPDAFSPATLGQPAALAGLGPRLLRRVLARYDIGAAMSIEPILRGGSRSPKLLVTTDRGRFVLKQHEGDDPFAVAFTHRVLLHLADAGVPVPALVGTHDDNNSIVQAEGRVFHLARVIDGRGCLATDADAHASGTMLRRVHDAFDTAGASAQSLTQDAPDPGDEHARISGAFKLLATRLNAEGREVLDSVRDAFDRAREARHSPQEERTPSRRRLVHGDWHPGNLIMATSDPDHGTEPVSTVVGVLDLDRCRLGLRESELAFAALQHGMTKGDAPGRSCDQWPPDTALTRVGSFLCGYRIQSHHGVSTLGEGMIQRLIAEGVTRLATDGSVGRHPAPAVLRMIAAKSAWLLRHCADVRDMVQSALTEPDQSANARA